LLQVVVDHARRRRFEGPLGCIHKNIPLGLPNARAMALGTKISETFAIGPMLRVRRKVSNERAIQELQIAERLALIAIKRMGVSGSNRSTPCGASAGPSSCVRDGRRQRDSGETAA
jgi:hypothetical protein